MNEKLLEELNILMNLNKKLDFYSRYQVWLNAELISEIILDLNRNSFGSSETRSYLKKLFAIIEDYEDYEEKEFEKGNSTRALNLYRYEKKAVSWIEMLFNLIDTKLLKDYIESDCDFAYKILKNKSFHIDTKVFFNLFESSFLKMKDNSFEINEIVENPMYLRSFNTPLALMSLEKLKDESLLLLKNNVLNKEYQMAVGLTIGTRKYRTSKSWINGFFSSNLHNDNGFGLHIENEDYKIKVPRSANTNHPQFLLNIEKVLILIEKLSRLKQPLTIIEQNECEYKNKENLIMKEIKRLDKKDIEKMSKAKLLIVFNYFFKIKQRKKVVPKYTGEYVISRGRLRNKNNWCSDEFLISNEVSVYNGNFGVLYKLNKKEVCSCELYYMNTNELEKFIEENPDFYDENKKFLTKEGLDLFKLNYKI